MKRWAVVCDFDGTATMEDVADALSIAFIGRDAWEQANAAFRAGDIPFEELLRRIFEPIRATRKEIEDFTRGFVKFRPGFEQLVASGRERRIPFVLASGGLDLYIRPALELLPLWLTEGLQVRANQAEFTESGLRLRFPYRDAPGSCGNCGSCKGALVKELQAQGYRVVGVGDGNADRCMAGVADVLFARGRLLDWCREENKPCIPFEDFSPVVHLVACSDPS